MAFKPFVKMKLSEKKDDAIDKKRGIKDGSKADLKMDKKFGLPSDKKKAKK